jgi:hypothetical protein
MGAATRRRPFKNHHDGNSLFELLIFEEFSFGIETTPLCEWVFCNACFRFSNSSLIRFLMFAFRSFRASMLL